MISTHSPANDIEVYAELLNEVMFFLCWHHVVIQNIVCLQAKEGSLSRRYENPYHNPADNETALYAELKQRKIPNIAGFTVE